MHWDIRGWLILATVACSASSGGVAAQITTPMTHSVEVASPESGTAISSARRSVIELRANSYCGSGFVIGPRIIATSAHVVRDLCPFGECRELEVFGSISPNAPLSRLDGAAGEVLLYLPAQDVAVLQLAPSEALDLLPPLPIGSGTPAVGTAVTALGSRGCGSPWQARGTVSESDGHRLKTTVTGRYGASGSPLFNGNFEVIGAVSQIDGGLRGFRATLFGTDEPLAAANVQALRQRPFPSSLQQASTDLTYLSEQYLNRVASSTGLTRFLEGFEFMRGVHSIRESTPYWPGTAAALWPLYLTNVDQLLNLPDPALAPSIEFDEVRRKALYVALADHLEQVLTSNQRNLIGQVIAKLSDPELRALEPRASPLTSTYSAALHLGVKLLAIVIPLTFLWALSLGYVLGSSLPERSLPDRVATAVVVGLALWPISFLLWAALRRRHNNRENNG